MASMTTVISFFILLLATFSYSAPVGKEFENSTPYYEYTTDQPIVERAFEVQTFSPSDDESTIVPDERNQRSYEETYSGEVTTEGVFRPPRGFKEYTYPSSTETYNERSLDDFFYTTMESSTEFNRRALRPVQFEEDIESSTSIDSNRQPEMTTDVEPSSSVDSFGKYTGLLATEPTEEPTKQKPIQTQRLTKTVSIIPGKITETKIYANSPSKTSVVIQPVEEEQLSEGSTLLLFLLAAFLFCAFLMASTIAIFKLRQTLKRQSRITEMEADLDKHLLK